MGNRNYLWLLAGLFSLSITSGVRDALLLYVNLYYWDFRAEEISIFSIGSFLGYVIGFLFTARMHEIYGKRQVIVWSAVGVAIFPGLGIALRDLGMMFENGDSWLLPTQVVISIGSFASSSALNISAFSALADIADENEVRFGVRQEGILYSTRAMFSKLDYAIGTGVAGLILTLIEFPDKAAPGQLEHAVIDRLGFVYGPIATIPALVAAVFYAQYKITKEQHAENRRLIGERGGAVSGSSDEF